MKADATAEKRPAYPFVSGTRDMLTVTTHKYQGGVEVIVVPFAKALVVFVCFFPKLFMKARSGVRLLLLESRFGGCSQVLAKPVTSE